VHYKELIPEDQKVSKIHLYSDTHALLSRKVVCTLREYNVGCGGRWDRQSAVHMK